MDLTIQKIFLTLTVVSVATAYLIAGVVACDRFGSRSERFDKLTSNNDFVFAVTVVLWPVVGFFCTLYFRAVKK